MTRITLTIGSLKGVLLVLAALMVVPTLAFSQANSKYTNQKGGGEAAVRKTLDEIYAALGRNDAAALDGLYADSYTFVNETGVMTTKAPRIASIKSGELKYESLAFDDLNIRLYGDTAIATYNANVKGQFKGQAIGGNVRVTTAFVKINGRWQLVAAQATRIEQ